MSSRERSPTILSSVQSHSAIASATVASVGRGVLLHSRVASIPEAATSSTEELPLSVPQGPSTTVYQGKATNVLSAKETTDAEGYRYVALSATRLAQVDRYDGEQLVCCALLVILSV